MLMLIWRLDKMGNTRFFLAFLKWYPCDGPLLCCVNFFNKFARCSIPYFNLFCFIGDSLALALNSIYLLLLCSLIH